MCKVNSSLYYDQLKPVGERRDKAGHNNWVPNTDVYVTEGKLVVKVEIAGIRQQNLELTIDGNRLRISGQRPDGCRAPKCTFLVMEINYGPFECVIEIPKGYELNQATAAYQNGFLRVEIPQVQTASPTTIPIVSTEAV